MIRTTELPNGFREAFDNDFITLEATRPGDVSHHAIGIAKYADGSVAIMFYRHDGTFKFGIHEKIEPCDFEKAHLVPLLALRNFTQSSLDSLADAIADARENLTYQSDYGIELVDELRGDENDGSM